MVQTLRIAECFLFDIGYLSLSRRVFPGSFLFFSSKKFNGSPNGIQNEMIKDLCNNRGKIIIKLVFCLKEIK